MIRSQNVNYITDNREIILFLNDIMQQDQSIFIGRAGGSDWDVIKEYYENKELFNDDAWYEHSVYRVKRFNGYFDFTGSKDNFKRYLETMIDAYKNTDYLSYGNQDLILEIESKKYIADHNNLLSNIIEHKTIFSYTFIESMVPFLESFKSWGENKKILIVSPLSKSIQHQFAQKHLLYKNYQFPNFELKTYNTSITYSNAAETNETLGIPTDNWNEEAHRMAEEIKDIDFDIALLTCGSYAMYLGNYIKDSMNKKAIYLGGILNMYFNIYGGRYNIDGNYKFIYENSGLNLDYQIDPLELDHIDRINSGRGKRTESLNAYFGKKDGSYSTKARKS